MPRRLPVKRRNIREHPPGRVRPLVAHYAFMLLRGADVPLGPCVPDIAYDERGRVHYGRTEPQTPRVNVPQSPLNVLSHPHRRRYYINVRNTAQT